MKKYKLKKASVNSVSFKNADMYGCTFFQFVLLIKVVEKSLNTYYSKMYKNSHPAEVIIHVTVGCDSGGTLEGFYLEVNSGLMNTKTDMYIDKRVFKIRLTDYLIKNYHLLSLIENLNPFPPANDDFIGQR
jgi:hypothetical protein